MYNGRPPHIPDVTQFAPFLAKRASSHMEQFPKKLSKGWLVLLCLVLVLLVAALVWVFVY